MGRCYWDVLSDMEIICHSQVTFFSQDREWSPMKIHRDLCTRRKETLYTAHYIMLCFLTMAHIAVCTT